MQEVIRVENGNVPPEGDSPACTLRAGQRDEGLMTDQVTAPRSTLTKVLRIVGLVVLAVVIIVVFLVLTGIIAEPETVIEQIAHLLLGR